MDEDLAALARARNRAHELGILHNVSGVATPVTTQPPPPAQLPPSVQPPSPGQTPATMPNMANMTQEDMQRYMQMMQMQMQLMQQQQQQQQQQPQPTMAISPTAPPLSTMPPPQQRMAAPPEYANVSSNDKKPTEQPPSYASAIMNMSTLPSPGNIQQRQKDIEAERERLLHELNAHSTTSSSTTPSSAAKPAVTTYAGPTTAMIASPTPAPGPSQSTLRAQQAETEAQRLREQIQQMQMAMQPAPMPSASAIRAQQAEAEAQRMREQMQQMQLQQQQQLLMMAAATQQPVQAPTAPMPSASTVRAEQAEAVAKQMREQMQQMQQMMEKMQRQMISQTSMTPALQPTSGGLGAVCPSVARSTTGASVAETATQRTLRETNERLERERQSLAEAQNQANQEDAERRRRIDTLRHDLNGTPQVSNDQMAEMLRIYGSKVSGVDLCFLMDCTGSMSPWIQECIAKIGSILDPANLINLPRNSRLNVAFVGYRDHDHGQKREIVFDFIPYDQISRLRDQLSRIDAIGGADIAEDVAGGILNVSKLKWSSSTKLIIHFGDAPPHGTHFHDGKVHDLYPQGCPKNVNPESLLAKMCANGIDYYFVELRPDDTAKMVDLFYSAYNRNRDGPASGLGMMYVLQKSDDPSQFLPTVVKSIKTSRSNRAHIEAMMAKMQALGYTVQ